MLFAELRPDALEFRFTGTVACKGGKEVFFLIGDMKRQMFL